MGHINKIPLGYLNMLGSQTGGKNPFNAAEVLAPTQEMTPFYHAQAMRMVQVSSAMVLGSVQSITVPDDEVWMVYGLNNQRLTATNSDTARYQNFVSFPNSPSNGYTIHITDELLNSSVAGVSIIGDQLWFNNPIPLTQGATIGQVLRLDGGVPDNHTLQVAAAIFKG